MAILSHQGYDYYHLHRPVSLLEKAIKFENDDLIDQALGTYEKIIHRYPERFEAETALYNSALIWQNTRHNMTKALLLYLRLEQAYPQTKYLYPARREAAWIVKYSLADYYQAIGYYQRLYDMAASESVDSDDFLYEIADCYVKLENFEQAIIELESLLSTFPQSNLKEKVLYRIGELYQLINRTVKARESWQQVISGYPESSYSAKAQFNLARLEEENQNLEKALHAYQSLTNFPQQDLLKEKIQHLKQRIREKNKVVE